MARKSNTITGKGFEYAVLDAFRVFLTRNGVDVETEVSEVYETAKSAFEKLDSDEQLDYKAAASAAVKVIAPLEPRLVIGEDDSAISLRILPDARGEEGDVRDVVCARPSEGWEIGISCKHNHEALKHPRVTKDADFGKDWIGVPCSSDFHEKIDRVMRLVDSWVGTKWRDHDNKVKDVYRPVLEAFVVEIEHLCQSCSDAPAKMAGYFFGIEDFYKVIAKDRRGLGLAGRTKVMAFDIRGTLGKAVKGKRPLLSVPQISLPTRLIEIRIKPNSDTTIEMTFDRGWVIHMRLHNADSNVKTTGLKWDVTLSGMPNGLYEQEQPWLPCSDGDLICTYDFI